MVSFTGSTATGRAVMADGAATLKKVFLELGGKSAFLVLDDADLAGACSMSAFTASMHAGQGCAITTRLVVPRARYDEAVEAAAATMGSTEAGRPHGPGHDLRTADLGAAARPRAGLPRFGDRRGRQVRLRRRTSRRPRHRLLHRAHRHRRPRQQRQGRARGDLRAGADGDRPRRRRRRGAHRQRLAVRPVGHGVQLQIPSGPRGWPRGCVSAPSTSTAASGTRPTCRSAVTSSPASAGRWGSPVSRNTSKPKPLPRQSN